MADEFDAVPAREWWEISHRASDALWIALGALALAALIVLKLIQKGIIGSWGDLLTVPVV